jgi:hypothetical protein
MQPVTCLLQGSRPEAYRLSTQIIHTISFSLNIELLTKNDCNGPTSAAAHAWDRRPPSRVIQRAQEPSFCPYASLLLSASKAKLDDKNYHRPEIFMRSLDFGRRRPQDKEVGGDR